MSSSDFVSEAVAGIGAVFARWDAGESEFVELAEVLDITGPSMSRTTIDTTSLSSIGGYMTAIGGLRDPGTISFNMIFSADRYDLLLTDFEDSDNGTYQITLPDPGGSTLEFEALVTELPLSVPVNDKITCNVTFKISGPVTFTPGTTA